MNEVLGIEVADGVALLTLDRPDRRNALNHALKDALADALDRIGSDADVRAVVLTGAGASFCVGGDIDEMALNTSPEVARRRLQRLLRLTFEPLFALEKPTIAAVNGDAYGAGLSLALACDLVFAAESASANCAFSRMGLVPDCGALYLLPRRVGTARAKHLHYSAETIDAAEGLRIGLFDEVVPDAELLAFSLERARRYAASPPVSLALAKGLLNRSLESSWDEMAGFETLAQAIAYSTDEHATARARFLGARRRA